jgi:Ribose/xylose/arabinose/galactoside ABC-type transport systems, permease components
MDVKGYFKKQLAKQGMRQVLTVAIGLVFLCVAFGIINPMFFSTRNISNLLRQIAPIILIGVAQSFVLITGNIDLSIGSVVGVSTMLSATLMTKGMDPWLAAFITVLVSLVFGLANGYLVAGFKLPPFIATLGTMTIGRGVAQIVNNNYNTGAINTIAKTAESVDKFRNFFYYGKTVGVYNGVWIALFIFLCLNFFLNRSRNGRYLYALGSNPEAARLLA